MTVDASNAQGGGKSRGSSPALQGYFALRSTNNLMSQLFLCPMIFKTRFNHPKFCPSMAATDMLTYPCLGVEYTMSILACSFKQTRKANLIQTLAAIVNAIPLILVDSLGRGPTHPSISKGIILLGSSYHGYLVANVIRYKNVCDYLLYGILWL